MALAALASAFIAEHRIDGILSRPTDVAEA